VAGASGATVKLERGAGRIGNWGKGGSDF